MKWWKQSIYLSIVVVAAAIFVQLVDEWLQQQVVRIVGGVVLAVVVVAVLLVSLFPAGVVILQQHVPHFDVVWLLPHRRMLMKLYWYLEQDVVQELEWGQLVLGQVSVEGLEVVVVVVENVVSFSKNLFPWEDSNWINLYLSWVVEACF